MSARTAARRRQIALRLTAGAIAWSVGLVLVALLAPVYGSSTGGLGDDGVTLTHATLVQVNGVRALALMVVPGLAALVVAGALRARWADQRWSRLLAWAAVMVVAAETVVGILSIGIFILPVTLLLAAAVRLSSGAAVPLSSSAAADAPGDETDAPGELAPGT
jgi:hypothetical protein